MTVLRSRANAQVKRWRLLAREVRLRRAERRALLEGTHLVGEYLECVGAPVALLVAEGSLARPEIASLVRRAGIAPVVLADSVFAAVVDAESPTGIAAEIPIREVRASLAVSPLCVLLEGVQDAGNVGVILRSAAAFGVRHAVLSRGCADAWSPKVLRAAMGGHFRLDIIPDADLPDALDAFGGRAACAVPRGGTPIHQADLSGRLAWIFGAEGKGVSDTLRAGVRLQVSIPMPGGAESLNVGSAAAICLYESFRQQAPASSSRR